MDCWKKGNMTQSPREVIMSWDLTQVLRFLINRWKYEQRQAELLLIEYRRFMIMSVENQEETIPVSDVVDEVWHAHLLFTEDYGAFCQAVVGEYLHHYEEYAPFIKSL